jgi:23S rRNA (adenine2503-C2)-methyltransferase
MTPLSGLMLSEIEKLLTPLPRYRSSQIYKWILKGVNNFEEMTNISASLRNELNDHFCLYSTTVDNIHEDGETKKIVISLNDGSKIESVLLSDGKKRLTACLSTQVGCPAGCVFCKTGSLGVKRNLTSAEIVEQFLHLRFASSGKDSGHIIDNIVIMGMGEPLLNLEELRKAIIFFSDPAGMNFSKRRITVSTCGICDSLDDLVQNGPFTRLALSLTTADETLRQKLMPITKSNPLEQIKENLMLFQRKSGGRITLEIPLLKQINTRDTDAKSIAVFANGLDTIINIIPWNPVAGLEFEGKPLYEPDKKETEDFISILESYKLKVTMRLGKGRSCSGACGQLGVIN